MTDDLRPVLDDLRVRLLDDAALVRAIASGRRGGPAPSCRRVDLRYVDLREGRRLQVTRTDERQAHVDNHALGEAPAVVDALLTEPFGDWRVETAAEDLQVRVSRKGRVRVHVAPHEGPDPDRRHDRAKRRLLPADDPVFAALGIADADGRIKPSRRAKARQVEEFVRDLDAALDDAGTHLRTPDPRAPLRVVDLGCGNGYLTFAAARYLESVRGLPLSMTGVDVRASSRAHDEAVAAALGVGERVRFVDAAIDDYAPTDPPDVVLALHACDTATDDALARAVGWDAPLVLAAPCCHRDVARQLRRADQPFPTLTRDGILRERFADTLTDALRAAILRLVGYRVEVVEFVESRHTPRNTLLRAVRTGAAPSESARRGYAALVETWHVRPRLAVLLQDRLPPNA